MEIFTGRCQLVSSFCAFLYINKDVFIINGRRERSEVREIGDHATVMVWVWILHEITGTLVDSAVVAHQSIHVLHRPKSVNATVDWAVCCTLNALCFASLPAFPGFPLGSSLPCWRPSPPPTSSSHGRWCGHAQWAVRHAATRRPAGWWGKNTRLAASQPFASWWQVHALWLAEESRGG